MQSLKNRCVALECFCIAHVAFLSYFFSSSIENNGTCIIAYQSQFIGENFAFITLRYVHVIELSLSRLVAKIGDTFHSDRYYQLLK